MRVIAAENFDSKEKFELWLSLMTYSTVPS